MRYTHRILSPLTLAALAAWSGGAFAAAEPADKLTPRQTAALEADFLTQIDCLLPGMGAEDLVAREKPQLALEKICFAASAPGKEAERQALCRAMMARTGPEVALPARVWILRKVEPLGKQEVVPALATLLCDPDPQIRELARRALQNNPSPRAGTELRKSLAKADTPAWRIALINSLAARREADSVDPLRQFAKDNDDAVATAAIAGLADIGTPPAIREIQSLRRNGRLVLRDTTTHACLRCAEQLLATGQRDQAATIYQELSAPPEKEAIRIAALQGLMLARGAQSVPMFVDLLGGEDHRIQWIAAQCLRDMPDPKTTDRLAAALQNAAPAVRAVILEVLGQRGEKTALPAVTAQANSSDPAVRLAALQALRFVGDASSVRLLAERMLTGPDDERQAARDSLAGASGADVDRAVLAAIESAEPHMRAELVKIAAVRRIPAALPVLYAATGDADESVRVAVIIALGNLGSEADLPRIVALLPGVQDEATRQAVEEAVASVSLRMDDRPRRAAPVIAALPTAPQPARSALVRILGRLEGDAALAAVREQTASPDAAVRDTAINVLAKWSEPTAIPALLDLARSAEQQAHRQAALRGYVRLVRLPSGRSRAETFAMLKDAMALASEVKDRKTVLAAMHEAGCLEALQFVLPLLDDADLRAEAETAVLGIAVAVSGQHGAQAVAALERLRDSASGDDLRGKASRALDSLKQHVVAWLFSGPYQQAGKGAGDLFDLPFPPEDPQGNATWQPLEVTNLDQPGQFALGDFPTPPSNVCGYVRTAVWSENEQPALLILGSDDGAKVWLNGQVVHAANLSRGITCGEDKAAVTLKAGWNTLLLKITQGGGGWGFCCSVLAPDGSPLPALKFEPR
ncbi:MAG: hypothetical protein GXY55_03410 [Phycisphaerae bacterium]|nr:hypothetical protein [Phycisphaerae bacterium]